ncbi:MAG: RluA family pseudouridine synthase [Tissierellales bacterium]|nr:RluA family pseudouridine synthase [Tissierellales bacterium]MBN2827682.1 RluA family pseudouridine synthase [Tissierellales bacterium]
MIHIIKNEERDIRLDVFLNEHYDTLSRSYIQKLIKDEMILVNELPAKKNYLLKSGDIIQVNVPEPEPLKIEAEDIELEIIYEDQHIAVVNKPRGMVVHPAKGNYNRTMVNALMFKLDNLSSINGIIRPGIVHRIDKNTTGILVVAKDDFSHQSLSKQIKEHKASRKYVALVHGKVKNDFGTISLPIGRDSRNRKKMGVTTNNAKEAVTHYKVLKNFGDYTLLELQLETGRTHQIRVHLSYLGHPIVGDEVYGRKNNAFKMKGQLLHAKSLSFNHPINNQLMSFNVDLPKDFKNILSKLENREG